MFATLVLERDPLKLEFIPADVQSWLLTAGSFAAVALAIWLLVRVIRGKGPDRDERPWPVGTTVAVVLACGFLLMLLPVGLQYLWDALGWSASAATVGKSPLAQVFARQDPFA